MIDAWFGRMLDAIDRRGLWEDTAVIVCTDHGHYLGEKDLFGKPASPIFEPLGHTPLLVAWPGVNAGAVEALTTNVDLYATLMDLFGVESKHTTHGKSLVPLIVGEADSVREHALAGYWGREVHLLDGQHKYVRGPVGKNEPLSMWSNRWSTMPLMQARNVRLPHPDDRAFLDRMPGSNIPVLRQPFRQGDMLPYWGYGDFSQNLLFDLHNDPAEEENLVGSPREKDLADHLHEALREIEAPDDHFIRLGLT
jgi:arylsulfatase A-like enzyme